MSTLLLALTAELYQEGLCMFLNCLVVGKNFHF